MPHGFLAARPGSCRWVHATTTAAVGTALLLRSTSAFAEIAFN
eukprot:CAMPEP_0172880530 /NCGR_PEP_ID=MMETSP1075-20121228/115313_1 /TAXON_ID=2916 /ORGANISM="Ceratium fusus, Strain PA161109" /LENGTH=42 /DNA_ID= /DNA_START= /DNA_END= /DNA_ORIENTATION=